MENILLKKLKICVLVSNCATPKHLNENIKESPNPQTFLPSTFKPPWDWETRLISSENVFKQIMSLKKLEKFDVFFNLCNSEPNNYRTSIEVIKALNFFNLPYTGSDEKCFNIRKKDMKMIALATGIHSPRHYFAFNQNDIYLASKHLNKYPLIVKVFSSQEIFGKSPTYKCNDFDELHERSNEIVDKYGGALIEEFVEGREFSVLVVENPNKDKNPYAMKPVEIEYNKSDPLIHLENRQTETSFMLSDNKVLNERLCDMARKVFVNMHGKSYARIDFRVNENHDIYLIEINYTPPIFISSKYSRSDYILENDALFKAEKFIQILIELALKDQRMRQLPYCVGFREDVYGQRCIIAARDIMKGELVLKCDEEPQNVISLEWAQRKFKGHDKREWFQKNAYPIGESLFVCNNPNGSNLPINHSCEPNLWFDHGDENKYARRAIKKGEELTLDYCTFLVKTPGLGEYSCFDCKCGEKSCRKIFSLYDCFKEELIQKYRGHFSVYLTNNKLKHFLNINIKHSYKLKN